MLTIGYVGNGKSTNRYHLPFSLSRKNIKVKTIYSRDPEKKDWEKIEGIHYTGNITDIMEDDDIQLVVVCTYTDSHYEYAKMALDHGKNVLVEKPFMLTSEEAISIFDYAKEKGLFIQCYQNRRYDSDFLTTQKVIESGKLGSCWRSKCISTTIDRRFPIPLPNFLNTAAIYMAMAAIPSIKSLAILENRTASTMMCGNY